METTQETSGDTMDSEVIPDTGMEASLSAEQMMVGETPEVLCSSLESESPDPM